MSSRRCAGSLPSLYALCSLCRQPLPDIISTILLKHGRPPAACAPPSTAAVAKRAFALLLETVLRGDRLGQLNHRHLGALGLSIQQLAGEKDAASASLLGKPWPFTSPVSGPGRDAASSW